MTTNPCALITGSSRGIGLGIIKALAKENFNVILNAPKESQALFDAEKALIDSDAKVKTLILDISNTSAHSQAVTEAFDFFGGIDCLVNNAGVSVKERGDLLNLSVESFDEQIDVNLKGTFFLTQAVAKKMIEQSSEHFRSIITISSSNAVAASIERGEYCLAKSALEMMNKLFAVRLAGNGINTYEIRPGLINTDMTRSVKPKYDRLLKDGFSPINRWGETDDVAETVTMLAKGGMKFSTGEALHIDGGLLINRY